MRVCIGDTIESEFGKGPVTAITEQWIIHKDKQGEEYALLLEDNNFWIPAEPVQGSSRSFVDVPESTK